MQVQQMTAFYFIIHNPIDFETLISMGHEDRIADC